MSSIRLTGLFSQAYYVRPHYHGELEYLYESIDLQEH